ncbi:MAG TPA: hypothetical protein VER76_21965 [Pyrinomonadaceae bacterium]|nr:hypothetical protein [Pyrinomonadaceae bacterium]
MDVASKPFNRVFRITDETTGKVVYLNGEQIARIEILKTQQEVIFYTSDGNTFTLKGEGAAIVIKVIEAEAGSGRDN